MEMRESDEYQAFKDANEGTLYSEFCHNNDDFDDYVDEAFREYLAIKEVE